MAKAILMLATTLLLAGSAAAQPGGRMAPGSGSGSAPGTGATTPGYEAQEEPKSSGSIKRDTEKERGSIGAGHMEPGGSGPRTTSGTTVPSRP